jgi:hypothetical protein
VGAGAGATLSAVAVAMSALAKEDLNDARYRASGRVSNGQLP